jgi:uncharacterized membrane protein
METSVIPPEPEPEPRSVLGTIRARIVSGLFLALPIVITFWIVYWIYITFHHYLLDPITDLIQYLKLTGNLTAMPEWWDRYVAPLVAVLLALLTLYLLGLLVQSRWHRMLNWVLLHVPVVTTIYQAVNNLFDALNRQRQANQFKRVVLVEFPQPGMRSLGVVTNTLRDERTGKPIVCVCVLTGVMPPTGFTLFVPEEKVTDLPWTMNQMIQAVVSGGITLPETIRYYSDGEPALEDEARPPEPLSATGSGPAR